MIEEKAKDTAARRQIVFTPPCKKTIKRLELKIGCKTKKAETTTDARLDACKDVINFLTFASMNYLMFAKLKTPHDLIINIDATQFMVGSCKLLLKFLLSNCIKNR